MKNYDSAEYNQKQLNEALISSVEVNEFISVEALLKAGANPSCFQNKAFTMASWEGNLKLFKLLLKNLSPYSTERPTIIQDSFVEASYFGHLEMVKYLHKQGAQIFAHAFFAVKECIDNNQLDVLKFFVQKKINVGYDYDYFLRTAESNGYLDIANYLISVGANPTATQDYELIQAIRSGLDDLAIKLINSQYSNLSSYEDTPIKLACSTNNLNIVQHLVNKSVPFSLVEEVVNEITNDIKNLNKTSIIPDIVNWINSKKLSEYLNNKLPESTINHLSKLKL